VEIVRQVSIRFWSPYFYEEWIPGSPDDNNKSGGMFDIPPLLLGGSAILYDY